MPRTLSLVCASALLLAVSSTALADEPQSEVVSYADLNLDDRDDAAVLVERIERAAENVCGRDGPQALWEARAGRECATETMEWTIRDFGHPVVVAEFYGVYPRVIVEEGSADPDGYDYDYVTVTKKPSY